MRPVVYVVNWKHAIREEERKLLLGRMPSLRKSRLPAGQEELWEQPLAAWGLLSLGLRKEFGLKEIPAYQIDGSGKPCFTECGEICFSLSHTAGIATCALWNRPVGVDVERVRPISSRMMKTLGAADEWEFFSRWTAREAAAKRLGAGSIRMLCRSVEGEELCRVLPVAEDGLLAVSPGEECDVVQLSWEMFLSELQDEKSRSLITEM